MAGNLNIDDRLLQDQIDYLERRRPEVTAELEEAGQVLEEARARFDRARHALDRLDGGLEAVRNLKRTGGLE